EHKVRSFCSLRHKLPDVIGSGESFNVTAQRGDITYLDRVTGRQLVLSGQIVALSVGRLVVELDSSKVESTPAHGCWIERNSQKTSFQGSSSSIGVCHWGHIVHRGE